MDPHWASHFDRCPSNLSPPLINCRGSLFFPSRQVSFHSFRLIAQPLSQGPLLRVSGSEREGRIGQDPGTWLFIPDRGFLYQARVLYDR